ncbi:MAG: N-acetyltransferase [Ewingella sp.]|uniref:N-acetyltransferase n=1 Tax=Ewingella TaxID=41201 RepID=UPI003365611B
MIRLAALDDTQAIMLLWLKSTLAAHPFIEESYWFESAAMVREEFLPKAITWVSCDAAGEIEGFISVLNKQFIGALFIKESLYGQGVAQQLMQQAKANFPLLLLEVYQQNHRAVAFYRKEGFLVVNETTHPGTSLPTWVLRWQKPLAP